MRRHRLIVYCLLLAGAAANAAPDGEKQLIPEAWIGIEDVELLADFMASYFLERKWEFNRT